MKNLSNSNRHYQAYYREPSVKWNFISLAHCLVYSWLYGLFITYMFRLIFGITKSIFQLVFTDDLFITIIETVANAPYWLYGTLFCLLCLHLGRAEMKTSRSGLALVTVLSFAHEAMIVERLMVIFYVACLFGIISELLHLNVFARTFLFNWPLCKKETVYPFNLSLFILTIIVFAVLWLILYLLEIPKILILSIVSVLFKLTALENFTEYYDIVYEKFYHRFK